MPYQKPLSKVALTSSLPGKIVFATTAVVKGESQSLIIIEQTKRGKNPTKEIYKVAANDHVFRPQFSPDGRYVSFKVGYVWHDYGQHKIHIWDTSNNKIKTIPLKLNRRDALWSPTSKYLAFVQNGKEEGQLNLCIFDVQKNQTRIIKRNSTLQLNTWSQNDSLIFTESTLQNKRNFKVNSESPRPSIYEALPNGVVKILIKQGYDAVPSPDGQIIAFIGWADESKPDKKYRKEKFSTVTGLATSPSLYLFDQSKQERILLEENLENAVLRWTPDGKNLIVVKTTQKGAASEALINSFDTDSHKKHLVAILKSKDYEPLEWSTTNPKFDLFKFSSDGRYLIILVTEFTGVSGPLLDGVGKLQAINLETGAVSAIAISRDDFGMDWSDTMALSPNNLAPKALPPQPQSLPSSQLTQHGYFPSSN